MSGGVAYVLDSSHDLYRRVNKEMVSIELLTERHDIEELKRLIQEHYEATHSPLAQRILGDFDEYVPQFKKIMPNDYRRMLDAIASLEKRGMARQDAEIEAFYQNTRG